MSTRFPFTLIQLSYFIECARLLNMTEASQRLHVAQSAVSAAISHLETQINTELFIRQHSRGLLLTPAGMQLLQDAQQIFDQLSSTVEQIGDRQSYIRGTARVACFGTLGPFLLPPLLSRLGQRYPELRVEILEGDFITNMQDLRTGRADLAVTYDVQEVDSVTTEPLRSDPPYALVGPRHRLAKRSTVRLHDFADDRLVLLNLPHSREYFLNVLLNAGLTPDIAYRTENFETARSLVARGLGYTILNQRPATDLSYSGTRTVALALMDPLPELRIVLATRSKSPQSARSLAISREVKSLLSRRGELVASPRT